MGGDIILEGCSHEHIAVFVDPEVTGCSQLSHNLIDKFTLKQHPMFLQTDTLTFSSTSEQIFTFETDLRFKKKTFCKCQNKRIVRFPDQCFYELFDLRAMALLKSNQN